MMMEMVMKVVTLVAMVGVVMVMVMVVKQHSLRDRVGDTNEGDRVGEEELATQCTQSLLKEAIALPAPV